MSSNRDVCEPLPVAHGDLELAVRGSTERLSSESSRFSLRHLQATPLHSIDYHHRVARPLRADANEKDGVKPVVRQPSSHQSAAEVLDSMAIYDDPLPEQILQHQLDQLLSFYGQALSANGHASTQQSRTHSGDTSETAILVQTMRGSAGVATIHQGRIHEDTSGTAIPVQTTRGSTGVATASQSRTRRDTSGTAIPAQTMRGSAGAGQRAQESTARTANSSAVSFHPPRTSTALSQYDLGVMPAQPPARVRSGKGEMWQEERQELQPQQQQQQQHSQLRSTRKQRQDESVHRHHRTHATDHAQAGLMSSHRQGYSARPHDIHHRNHTDDDIIQRTHHTANDVIQRTHPTADDVMRRTNRTGDDVMGRDLPTGDGVMRRSRHRDHNAMLQKRVDRRLSATSYVLLRKCFVAWRAYSRVTNNEQRQQSAMDLKYRRAVGFRDATVLQRCFSGWRWLVVLSHRRAEEFHRRCLLRRSMDALAWHVCRARLRTSTADMFRKNTLQRTALQKWRTAARLSQRRRLSDSFEQWRMLASLKKREKLLSWQLRRHLLEHSWSLWQCQALQPERSKVALEFRRTSLLRSSWSHWRRRQRRECQCRLLGYQAQLYYEKTLMYKTYQCWSYHYHQHNLAMDARRKSLLSKVFIRWWQWACLARRADEERQRKSQEFHQHQLISSTFLSWRQARFERTATKHNSHTVIRNTFSVWHKAAGLSQALRRKAEEQHATHLVSSFFRVWLTRWHASNKEYLMAVEHSDRRVRVSVLSAWRRMWLSRRDARVRVVVFRTHRQSQLLSEVFATWRDQTVVQRQRRLAHVGYSSYCVRKAFTHWRHCVYVARLGDLASDFLQQRHVSTVQATFVHWYTLCLHRSGQRCLRAMHSKSLLHASFSHWWKHCLSMKQAVALRRQHQHNAAKRCISAWHAHCRHKRLLTSLVEHAQWRKKRALFHKWRARLSLRHHDNVAIAQHRRALTTSSFRLWRALTSLQTHVRVVRERVEHRLVAQCFAEWRQRRDDRLAEQSRLAEAEVHRWQLLSTVFAEWRQVTSRLMQRHHQSLSTAELHHRLIVEQRTMAVWRRQSLLVKMASDFQLRKTQHRCKLILYEWHLAAETAVEIAARALRQRIQDLDSVRGSEHDFVAQRSHGGLVQHDVIVEGDVDNDVIAESDASPVGVAKGVVDGHTVTDAHDGRGAYAATLRTSSAIGDRTDDIIDQEASKPSIDGVIDDIIDQEAGVDGVIDDIVITAQDRPSVLHTATRTLAYWRAPEQLRRAWLSWKQHTAHRRRKHHLAAMATQYAAKRLLVVYLGQWKTSWADCRRADRHLVTSLLRMVMSRWKLLLAIAAENARKASVFTVRSQESLLASCFHSWHSDFLDRSLSRSVLRRWRNFVTANRGRREKCATFSRSADQRCLARTWLSWQCAAAFHQRAVTHVTVAMKSRLLVALRTG
ncbi:uncharacterized protein LOC135824834 isoform X2 [Sycon ciliatum]|uniref:uncharacterized protein LOC135824834 isoform X2 n=1 Tax=Sycon ciliatum TaxID=27933 RepID=UPI0031F61C05